MARFESEIPCLILDDDELQKKAAIGEWREDKHNLEAARIFGSSGPNQGTFPTAFQSYRPDRKATKNIFRSSKVTCVSTVTTGSLIETVRTAFPADPPYARVSPPASPKVVQAQPHQ